MAAVIVVIGLFGIAIGSFLNVVIWRLPRGESVAHPPSHCPSCDTAISPRDNIPVVSWLLLRGRCRTCANPISVRYPLVEAGTCALFVAFGLHFGIHADLPAYLYLAALGVALGMIDLDLQRLPDVLTLPSYPIGLALLGIAAIVDHAPHAFVRALLAMVALFAFYALVWFVYPAGMGLGDVKLAGVLGLYLGWLGWGQLAVGAFAAFVVGGILSIAIVVLKDAGRKTRIPFGPFMLIGVVIGIYAGHPLAHAYTSGIGA
ncbi:MAG TPA: prepilin peptidase [Mycobacteriales bacterium]|jgi:leader peptidase (prepilin peptidase)/N-methyltransferase|nr:prepilin peptidase [Mycobacteriales bacterium]